LDARIEKEIAESKGGTVWSDRKDKLERCIAQKNRDMLSVKWEQQYAEFEGHVMPERGSKLYNWQNNQLSIGHAGLDARIVKDNDENEGVTLWSDRKDTLERCIAQKKAI
jgi:hypothetical protein